MDRHRSLSTSTAAAPATREGGPLSYAWDLDGDGAFDDSTAVAPSFTYNAGGNYDVRLRVTDNQGALHGHHTNQREQHTAGCVD